ncbi:MAG: DNA adenine methylase, partial [Candidatus Gastranaerophilaceae bacterium]
EADNIIYRFKLSKENQDGYNNLRDYYNNQNSNPMVFYILLCYAFNNQIRFNHEGKYNMPFGKNRSSFNPMLRKRFILFVESLQRLECDFTNFDFRCFPYQILTDSDFVYCDPPYYNSTATYNEQNGWNEKDEIDLLNILDGFNEKGIKFALSNNLKYKNPVLDSWKDKYNLHILNINYNNCNYHKNNKEEDKEILITNY